MLRLSSQIEAIPEEHNQLLLSSRDRPEDSNVASAMKLLSTAEAEVGWAEVVQGSIHKRNGHFSYDL